MEAPENEAKPYFHNIQVRTGQDTMITKNISGVTNFNPIKIWEKWKFFHLDEKKVTQLPFTLLFL